MKWVKETFEEKDDNFLFILGVFLLSRIYLKDAKRVIEVINVYVTPNARSIPKFLIGGTLELKKDIKAIKVVSHAKNIAVPMSLTDLFMASAGVLPFSSSAR